MSQLTNGGGQTAGVAAGIDTAAQASTVRACVYLYYPSTAVLSPQRSPVAWKTASASAINTTALWTPTGGKKFRLMGFSWAIPSTATSAAGSVVSLLDSAATICYVAAIGTTTGAITGQVQFNGNGYISAAADQVLYMQLSAAFTAGAIYMTAWGTEE